MWSTCNRSICSHTLSLSETPSSVLLTKATSHILKLDIFVIYHSCFLCLFLKPRSVVEGGETHRCRWRAVKVWLEFQTLSRLVYTSELGKKPLPRMHPVLDFWAIDTSADCVCASFHFRCNCINCLLKKHGHKFPSGVSVLPLYLLNQTIPAHPSSQSL